MKKVRFGIVGLGVMGRQHAQSLLAGKIRRAELAAVADYDAAKLAGWPPEVACFHSPEELFRSDRVDAVVIATPHFAHTPLGIAALAAGLHVLVEKPISVHKADAEKLVQAPRGRRQVFAAMFNQRSDPAYKKIRDLIQKGTLGKIQRINWIITTWFRPESYYRSGGWRATWSGEGGGVLINQALHQLDLWSWLFGQPDRVRAHCHFGKYHAIEVEDEVTAYCEYNSGATGVFITSTGEAPGTSRLEVTGEKARLVYENDILTLTPLAVPTPKFNRECRTQFGQPPRRPDRVFKFKDHGGQHHAILENFADAICRGRPLLAPAAEGVNSVELTNAMLLSAWTGREVALPMDGARYARWLKRKIAASTDQPVRAVR